MIRSGCMAVMTAKLGSRFARLSVSGKTVLVDGAIYAILAASVEPVN
jgi:hypothetical protein